MYLRTSCRQGCDFETTSLSSLLRPNHLTAYKLLNGRKAEGKQESKAKEQQFRKGIPPSLCPVLHDTFPKPRSVATNHPLHFSTSINSLLMAPSSPLFRLPAELRLTIYSHLLNSTVPITNPHYRRTTASTPSASISRVRAYPPVLYLSPAILLVCRLVSSEAVEVLYSGNTFVLTSATCAQRFAQFTDAGVVRQCVRDLRLKIDVANERTHAWSRYLAGSVRGEKFCADYAGLRKLEIRFCPLGGEYRQERNWLWDVVRGLVRSATGVETVVVRPLIEADGRVWVCLAEVVQACMMDGSEDKDVAVKRVRRVWEGKADIWEGTGTAGV